MKFFHSPIQNTLCLRTLIFTSWAHFLWKIQFLIKMILLEILNLRFLKTLHILSVYPNKPYDQDLYTKIYRVYSYNRLWLWARLYKTTEGTMRTKLSLTSGLFWSFSMKIFSGKARGRCLGLCCVMYVCLGARKVWENFCARKKVVKWNPVVLMSK